VTSSTSSHVYYIKIEKINKQRKERERKNGFGVKKEERKEKNVNALLVPIS